MEMLLKRALDARRISPPPAQVLTAGHAPCCDTVAGVVGSTPVLWIDRPLNPEGRGFWAKLEGLNPGGIKDRAALHMVQRARERGDLPPGGMIIESTSGTLGLGLALAGITYGHPVTLVTDPGLEPIMHRLLTAYGARVHVVDSPHPAGGWQEAQRQRVAELLAEHPGSFGPDQYHNPDNVAGYAPLALELVEVHWVAPGEAVRAARLLAGAQYVSGGWSVGAVALVAGWVARTEKPDARIAAVFPDGPQRYFDTVFNDDYCHRHGLLTAHLPTEPDEIAYPTEREVMRWTRCRHVLDPTAGQEDR